MPIHVTRHARERMRKYGVDYGKVAECLLNPQLIISGSFGRRIASRRLNGYALRVIYEEHGNHIVVVTVYKTRAGRYEV